MHHIYPSEDKQKYAAKPVNCLPYAKNIINKKHMQNFYAQADYKLCNVIEWDLITYSESCDHVKEDFYKEFYALMRWIAEMTECQTEKNNLIIFACNVADPRHFEETNKIFYISIKAALEEIYYLLRNGYVSLHKRKEIIKELVVQLNTCKHRIYTTIMHIKNSMLAKDIYCLVAHYRLRVVLNSSEKFILDKKINDRDSMSSQMFFIKRAESYGFLPFGSEDNLNNIFSADLPPEHEEAEADEQLKDDFNENYTVEKIVKYVTNSFFSAVQELQFSKEINFADKIGNIYYQHGLADESGKLQYPEILEYSAGSLSFKFSKAAVEYSIAKTLHALGFAEISFYKIKITEGLLLLASHNRALMTWKDCKKQKIFRRHNSI